MSESNLPDFLCNHPLWETKEAPIWPASRFTIRRNLFNHLFPQKLKKRELKKIFEELNFALKSSEKFNELYTISIENLSPIEIQYLSEHYLLLHEFEETRPGMGFILDSSGTFMGLINFQDHLQLQMIEKSENYQKGWKKLYELDHILNKALNFAFSPTFGYMTADPAYCGTALSVENFLHIPMLNRLKEDSPLTKLNPHILCKGLKDRDEFVGDLAIIQNRYMLGLSEEHILGHVQVCTNELMQKEKLLREDLEKTALEEIKDAISKAYGLLKHSYQMDTKEALSQLSLLKLGSELNWISGLENLTLNDLFFGVRHAHLYLNQETAPEHTEIPHMRANHLKEYLKNIDLNL